MPLHKSAKEQAFKGHLLSEARMARGLSQSQLAELSGVAKQSISNYEKGKQAPRFDSIEKLALHLNIPFDFFFKDNVSEETAPIYFRSLSSLNKKERLKAEAKLNWLSRLLNCYDKYLELPTTTISNTLDISHRYTAVSDKEIEEIALECRKMLGVGVGPISNITMLLENNGVVVLGMPLDVKAEDAFSRWTLEEKIPVAVLVASQPSACRDRFSLVHELGHLVMHRKVKPTKDNLKLIEEQANRFASAFLLPAHSYPRDFSYPSLEVFKVLKKKWKVSIQAQVIRCWQLGIISSDSKRKFFINISKRKWRTKEPFDDTMQIESSKILKESTRILCEEGGMTLDDISHELSLPISDILQLTGASENLSISIEEFKPQLKSNIFNNKVIEFPYKKTT